MAMSKCRECGKAVSTLAKTCPSCGVPKPTKKTKTKKKTINKRSTSRDIVPNIKNYKKNNDKIWVHCRNYQCRDYTQMYQIYEDYLNLDKCNFCKSKFMEAKLRNGKPIMPTDGIYDKIKNKKSTYSSSSNTSSTSNTPTGDTAFDKFYAGTLDLPTAFWGFGVFGSLIVGLIMGFLSEAVHVIFTWFYFAIIFYMIIALAECAETYKKEKLKKNASAVWGYLTQIYCGVGFLGLVLEAWNVIKN
jgi:hypothetical protein